MGDLLGRTIAHIHGRHPDEKVTLVLAGDVFDFLAGPSSTPFKDHFEKKLPDDNPLLFIEATLAEERKLTNALRSWIGAENRLLVVMSGNHDVELGLKEVQKRLAELLTAGMTPPEQDAALRRIEFSTDGTGYRCDAGGRSVWCFHGEASDGANYVNGSSVRKRIRSKKGGFQREEPPPSNTGTDLVVTALNAEKRTKGYVWVDLLKPEYEVCFPLLVYLDGFDYQRIGAAARAALGFGTTFRETLSGSVHPGPGASRSPPSPDEVRAAIEHVRGKKVLDGPLNSGTLSAGVTDLFYTTNLAWWARKGVSTSSFFEELDHHRLQTKILKFKAEQDGPKQWAVDQNGARVQVVIAGHTHARKRIEYDRETRTYLNTGTWASVMEISKVNILDSAKRDALFDLLSKGRSSKLRSLLDEHAEARSTGQPLPTNPLDVIRHSPTVAHVSKEEAQLREPIVDASTQEITLEVVKFAF
jgi:UDP-2,3-diacylglucosamine pyrophosphatase LpxH